LRTQICSGHARPEQKLAVCAGGLALGAEDRVELLAVLAFDADPAIADRAQNALLTQSLDFFLAASARPDADERLFTYCTDNLGEKPGVADAFAKSAACPTAHVARLANRLTAAGVQSLLDNLERFISDPQLVIAVANCPGATPEQRELLSNMEKGAIVSAEMAEAAAEIEPDPVKRETLMQRVTHMNVVQRLTLALKGGKPERMLLIKDPNKLVQRCFRLDDELDRGNPSRHLHDAHLHEELFHRAEPHQQSKDSARCFAAPVPAAYRFRPGETHRQQEYSRDPANVGPEAPPQAKNGWSGELTGRRFDRVEDLSRATDRRSQAR
jgi:hypothetical protein